MKKAKRKLGRPLLLAVAGAATLYVACGDESTSGNLMAVDHDLSAVDHDLSTNRDMAKPVDQSNQD